MFDFPLENLILASNNRFTQSLLTPSRGTLAVSLAKRAKKDVNKMTESYLTKNKVEFFLFTDKNMNRTIADEKLSQSRKI